LADKQPYGFWPVSLDVLPRFGREELVKEFFEASSNAPVLPQSGSPGRFVFLIVAICAQTKPVTEMGKYRAQQRDFLESV